ncbi:hypothetical protein [uncultured Flavobacterium sp.]|uniref:hypothetical protein n=1 Tax=uncultured Flavobacterium sp. TaxID=165435 RepID=UPI00259A1016|nr:hypothetical protein [uncultured Flavobacterium sp.]
MSIIDSIQEFFTKKSEEPNFDKNGKTEIQTSSENVSIKDFRPTYLDDKDKVEIIPATPEQKLQYSRHIDGIEFTDMPSVDFPQFSQAQLDSVPDIIDGVPVNEYEKKMILLGDFEYSASSNWSSTFSIDQDNNLVTAYHDIDANKEPFEVIRHISKDEVMFVNQNDIELKKGIEEKISADPLKKEQLEDLAQKMNKYYDSVGETMWNFNHKEGKEILEFTLKIKDLPDNIQNIVFDYLNLECPHRELYDNEKSYHQAIQSFNYEEKKLAQILNSHGLYPEQYPENFPVIKNTEVNYLNILLNDVTRILADNKKDLQIEKLDSQKHVQLSIESNLSINNIYGFTPTDQQKKDLENGKGITGEIQGKNYFIQLSAQEKNKGSLQILSLEKAKEFNLLPEANHNKKNIKHTGLRA